jgi:predicted metal-dependent hydrolase
VTRTHQALTRTWSLPALGLTSDVALAQSLPFLDLGPRKLEYSVVRGTSRRYTYFRFRPDLTLEVVVPSGVRLDVEKAITERTPWLIREYERAAKTRNVLDGGRLMLAGRLLDIVFVDGPGEGFVVDPEGGKVTVTTRDSKTVRELVRRWFLKESSAYAVRKVAELSERVGAKPTRVDVREIGKWGYCTRSGRLSFSWQLIALPERLREYVVLHELTHLLEFNHSATFRRKLARVCPDFRKRERELDLVVPYDRLAPP